jgi:hypothetical protein
MITDKQHDHLDLDLLHLIQLERETEGKRGTHTIGVGRERGVGSHLAGRGRRGGRGLTKVLQCRLGDDGITNNAVERRAVAPGAPDPGRGLRWRRWRSFPPLQCSLGRLGFVGWGVCGDVVNLVQRAVAPPSLYSTVRRGPTNHGLVGRPRPGRGNKSVTAFGP